MFQSAISCRDYEKFCTVCAESEEAALQLIVKYTNTDQDLLHAVIDHIHHGGKAPEPPFGHNECELQEAIARGDYRKTMDEGHHKIGHF